MPDIAAAKPLISALILPPVPWLLLALIGARWAAGRRRALGLCTVLLACAGLWMSCCQGTAALLQNHWIKPPAALSADDRSRLAALGSSPGVPTAAIWVLGGGRHPHAPEYGEADLTAQALLRLHYGVWLARTTGLPLGFTGGIGWAQRDALSEAATAARIAQRDFGLAMHWQETGSRDTRGNAALSIPMLRAAGIQEVVLVTHAAHMPRALRAFREAALASGGSALRVTPAPVAFVLPDEDLAPLRWMPSPQGFQNVYNLLHEAVGQLAGQ